MSIKIFRFTSLLLVFMFLVGCSSVTMIDSYPTKSLVLIDNKPTGVTPYHYWDRDPGMAEHKIEIRKEGYKSKESMIIKDNFAVRRLFAFFLVVPLAYLFDYPDQYFFTLENDPNATPMNSNYAGTTTVAQGTNVATDGEIIPAQKNSNTGLKTAKKAGATSVPQGKSVVYFYRLSNTMTKLLAPAIYDNNKKILDGLTDGSCRMYFIDPGKHVFYTSSATTRSSEITMDSKNAGEEIYVRMDILMKAFVGETKLSIVDSEQGRSEMTGCKPLE